MNNLKKQILLGKLYDLKFEIQSEITDSDFFIDESEEAFKDLIYVVNNMGVLDSDVDPE